MLLTLGIRLGRMGAGTECSGLYVAVAGGTRVL